MRVFVTGTDTDVGKTITCSWLCLHTNHAYFKPIQTGTSTDDIDKDKVKRLSNVKIYDSIYALPEPVSPHLAARLCGIRVNLNDIQLPSEPNLIVEGAGGVLVPLNENHLMVDLIKHLGIPVILVARSGLGTVNHTLLSLEALRQRGVEPLGVIFIGENHENQTAIQHYGKTDILACIPYCPQVTKEALQSRKLGSKLQKIFLTE